MNPEVLQFVKDAKLKGRIVDVGSFNVNGAVRDVVKIECGIDMRHGAGVDLVMTAQEMCNHFSDLDAVTFCETMEHVQDWRGALTSIWKTIKDNGKLVLTVPGFGKGYHAHPEDYWRWSLTQLKQIFNEQKIAAESPKLGCSFGVVVKKKTPNLDLTVEPIPVVKKEKKKR